METKVEDNDHQLGCEVQDHSVALCKRVYEEYMVVFSIFFCGHYWYYAKELKGIEDVNVGES
jgi:hypothetical protein